MSDCEHDWKDTSVYEVPAKIREICIRCGSVRVGVLLESLNNMPPGEIEYIQRLPPWTTEKPSEQGVFWYKENGVPFLAVTTVVFLRDGSGSYVEARIEQMPWGLLPTRRQRVDELNGQWAGPLEPPV